MSIALLGANVGQLQTLPPEFGGFDPTAIGPMLKIWVNVPEDLPEGTYDGEGAEGGAVIGQFSPAGTLEGEPYVSVQDLTVAVIPDNNYLSMMATLGAASGGTAEVSVILANKDTVGGGSFVVNYPGTYLTLDSLGLGARAPSDGVASFTTPVDSGTALADNHGPKQSTVTFSGSAVGPGGEGELIKLFFDVAEVGAGTMASVSLSSVNLQDPDGNDLPDQIAPPTGSTQIEFSFGDTLSLADMQGEGTAIIIDGQLHVPIVLKNATAVSVVNFYITEPAGQEDVLSLSDMQVMHYNRADGWTVTAADSGSYVQVIAYDPAGMASLDAGEGQLFHLVYDINLAQDEIPVQGGTTVDLDLGITGVELVDGSGNMLGVEAMGGVASLDYRVPVDDELVGPGASLPKAFALAQNHPNPFNPSTTINYQIPDGAGSVQFTLNVYDIRGKLVRTLDEGIKGPGAYSVFWDGTDNYGRKISSGVYFYRFISSEYSATRKMIMLK
jgi:hypothetical protein